MTRGNQRDKDRERSQARAEKNVKKKGVSAVKTAGTNVNADALAAKIAAKKAAIEAGTFVDKGAKDKGANYVPKKKVDALVNPHTGKKDPKWTEKMTSKGIDKT